LNGWVAEFRMTYTPNRRAGFHDRWHPLLSDVTADRAVVAASSVYRRPDLYHFDVVLYRLVKGSLGRADGWAYVGTAAGVHVEGRAAGNEGRHGDHVALLCSSTAPLWECRWCAGHYCDLAAAADCAASCWDAQRAAWAASQRRFLEATRDAWWAKGR
jgi:hypothetical protein